MENKNIIVRIPEPCTEDWNKMTPDKNGKFCGSCQKSVFDFTNKTDDEIKEILFKYKDQKLCGHFKKSQIDRPLNIRVNLNQLPHNVSMTKIFALSLLLTFGATLFGCYDPQGKKINGIEWFSGNDEQVDGKIEARVGEIAPPPEQLEKVEKIQKDTLAIQAAQIELQSKMEQYVAGGIGMQMIDPIIDSVYVPKTMEVDSTYEVHKTGEVMPEEKYYVKGNLSNNVIDENAPQEDTLNKIDPTDERRIMGGPISVVTYTEQVIESQNINREVEEKNNEVLKSSSFVVFPNPGKGEFTIKYEVIRRSEVRVDILDAQGKLITNISNIPKQYEGKYEIPVSLDVPNGIYFVCIIAEGKKNVSRVVVER
jgi:hypothetical protein